MALHKVTYWRGSSALRRSGAPEVTLTWRFREVLPTMKDITRRERQRLLRSSISAASQRSVAFMNGQTGDHAPRHSLARREHEALTAATRNRSRWFDSGIY